eukprot:TRINITY_DN829_c0_g2_i1.p1 TRINITY_DN829_c0_g2~~TRINITY_DN829_c0_g2_i1.p1  ORF type:complete len:277 (+),score=89.07 TRINITY_DN829_c0_g2_i1:59-889(+)
MLPDEEAFPGLCALGYLPDLTSLTLMQDLAKEECGVAVYPHLSLLAGMTDHPLLLLLAPPTKPSAPAPEPKPAAPAPAEGVQREEFMALAMLGCDPALPWLETLQACGGPEHQKEAARFTTVGAPAQPEPAKPEPVMNTAAVMQGPAAQALRQREEELKRREQALQDRERALATREQALTHGYRQASPMSPSKALQGVSGVIIDDEDLRELFATYDRDGTGFVSRSEFKMEYRNFEDYGLPLTDKELDRIFSRFGGSDDKLSFEEFSILMLMRAKI